MDAPRPSWDDLLAQTAELRSPWYELAAVLLHTACRFGEAAHATPESLCPAGLRIEPHELRDGTLWRPKRPSAIRTVPLPPPLALRLRDMGRGPRSLLFWPHRVRPPHVRTFIDNLRTAARRAGVPPAKSHDFRRARIVQALQAGWDPNTVRAAVGHRSLSTTLGYLEGVPIVASLPPVAAEADPNPAANAYLPYARPRNWRDPV